MREIVATKIVFSLMIASYYWMWERSDWKAYYTTIQNAKGLGVCAYPQNEAELPKQMERFGLKN